MMAGNDIHLLIISDDHTSHTGFGRVARSLITELLQQAPDITVRQIALSPRPTDVPRLVPTILNRFAPGKKQDYGEEAYRAYVKTHGHPDIIFLLGDWWYWKDSFLDKESRRQVGCFSSVWYYAPVDGTQTSGVAINAYRGADLLISMSPFGYHELRRYVGRDSFFMPHGFDPKMFSFSSRPKNARYTWGIVARNSHRKNIHAILQARELLPEEMRGRILMHVPKNDTAGGDLVNFIRHFGFRDVEFTDDVRTAPNEEAQTSSIVGVKDEDMHCIYHQMDTVVSAGREGFGLPYLEARVCGCKLVLPEYSAHYSMNYDGAFTYPIRQYSYRAETLGVLDIVPHSQDIAAAMQAAFEAPAIGKLPNAKELTWKNITKNLIAKIRQHGRHPVNTAIETSDTYRKRDHKIERSILVTMPASTGDVLLTTATLNGLKHKYPDHKLVFATGRQYFPLMHGCPWVDEVIQYVQLLHDDYATCHRHYDMVYTPHFETQLTANWVHGGKCVSLAEVYARHCGVELGEYWCVPDTKTIRVESKNYVTLHVGSGFGEQSARWYSKWYEVVESLKAKGIVVIQVGGKDDVNIDGAEWTLGQLTYQQLFGVLSKARVHIGIDSFPMHASAILGTKSVIIWGNTFPHATGPDPRLRHLMTAIEPIESDRPCCKPCHFTKCRHDVSCMETIASDRIVEAVLNVYA